jgi:PAS domain-containing protein
MNPADDDAAQQDRERVVLAWERLRAALGASGIGTWHLDLRTRIATYDESLNRIFGLPAADTQASLDARLEQIHPDDRDRVARAMDAAIRAKTEFSLEFRVVRPDGLSAGCATGAGRFSIRRESRLSPPARSSTSPSSAGWKSTTACSRT